MPPMQATMSVTVLLLSVAVWKASARPQRGQTQSAAAHGDLDANEASADARAYRFAVGLDGANYTGLHKMSLAEVKSSEFLSFFNENRGLEDLGESLNGCCVFALTDGYLALDKTFLAAYSSSGVRTCQVTLTAPVLLGGTIQPGTPHSEEFFPLPLNASLTARFSTERDYKVVGGCEDSVSSWALYSNAAAPPPGPPQCDTDPENRKDCGFNLDRSECVAKGCCYQDTDPRTFKCYKPSDVCSSVEPADRRDCGYDKNEDECLAKGCCYDDTVPFTYHCFIKPAPGPPSPPGPPLNFSVGLAGSSYTGFRKAELHDVQSARFVEFFNNNGGLDDFGESLSGCCVFAVGDGYLTADRTFVSAYRTSGTYMCQSNLEPPVLFGGHPQDGAPLSNEFFGDTLNTTFASAFTLQSSYNSLPLCGGNQQTWAIFVSHEDEVTSEE